MFWGGDLRCATYSDIAYNKLCLGTVESFKELDFLLVTDYKNEFRVKVLKFSALNEINESLDVSFSGTREDFVYKLSG